MDPSPADCRMIDSMFAAEDEEVESGDSHTFGDAVSSGAGVGSGASSTLEVPSDQQPNLVACSSSWLGSWAGWLFFAVFLIETCALIALYSFKTNATPVQTLLGVGGVALAGLAAVLAYQLANHLRLSAQGTDSDDEPTRVSNG